MTERIAISVVMPCLNEAETLESCIKGALEGLRECGVEGEILIADNGSTDQSREIALENGARVVPIEERGYGSAIMGGVREARGRVVVIGDADDSYDFRTIPALIKPFEQGYRYVQGCRLPSGGGTIEAGAMPFLHRWIGNPLLSALVRWWFGANVRDVHCGLRAFERQLMDELELQCVGMEFASEMVVKAAVARIPIAEVPVTLRRDGRVTARRHLRTFRDGWRHLRFLLLYSPRWLFEVPGFLLIALGLLGYGLALPRASIANIRFDVHTLLVASLMIICGVQAIAFSVLAKTFASVEGLIAGGSAEIPPRRLEWNLLLGLVLGLVGAALIIAAVNEWRVSGFGDLDYGRTMRWVIPGVMLTALGVQWMLSSFFLSLLTLRRR